MIVNKKFEDTIVIFDVTELLTLITNDVIVSVIEYQRLKLLQHVSDFEIKRLTENVFTTYLVKCMRDEFGIPITSSMDTNEYISRTNNPIISKTLWGYVYNNIKINTNIPLYVNTMIVNNNVHILLTKVKEQKWHTLKK